MALCPMTFPTTTCQRATGYDNNSISVPRSCSPTMESKDSSNAINGTRNMVRLARLTTTTANGSTFTEPVGALPNKTMDNASAPNTTVVAITNRLRKPARISCNANNPIFMRPPDTDSQAAHRAPVNQHLAY